MENEDEEIIRYKLGPDVRDILCSSCQEAYDESQELGVIRRLCEPCRRKVDDKYRN